MAKCIGLRDNTMIMKIFLITIQVVSFEYSNLRLEHRRLNR